MVYHYTVTVSNDGNGTATASPASGTSGTEVTLTATPKSGYRFKEWQVVSGGVTITDDKLTIGTANVEVKAIFEPASAVASVTTSGGTTTEYATLAEAVAVAQTQNGSTVKVLKDVTISTEITATSGNFTIDLNGKTVTCTASSTSAFSLNAAHNAELKVTFTDSSSEGKGQVIGTNGSAIGVATSTIGSGEIILEKGSYTGTAGVVLKSKTSKLTVADGVVITATNSFSYPIDLSAGGILVLKAAADQITGGQNYDIRYSGMYTTDKIDLSQHSDPTGLTIFVGRELDLSKVSLPDGYALFDANNVQYTGPVPENSYAIVGKVQPAASIVGVSILPASVTLTPGSTQQFTATVDGAGSFTSSVTWSVSGNTSANTTITTGGLLTVGADETATTLTVTAAANADTTKYASATVTVKQAATYIVTVNNGTGSGEYAEGASVTITANTPETGKQFAGWTGLDGLTITSGSTATESVTFIMPAKAVTVAAAYEDIPDATCTITFHPNGGAGTMEPQIFIAGEARVLTLNAFTREGFNFIGWNLEADGSGTSFVDGARIKTNGDATLYAQWEPVSVDKPLTIIKQPTDQFVVEGQRAEFSVEATGDGLTYQWYINRNDGKGWRELDGAIGTAYVTFVTDLDCDGFQYGCLITDQYGNTLKSDVVVLHVSKVPVIPETGDSATPMLWLAMSILSMAGIVLLRKKAYSR